MNPAVWTAPAAVAAGLLAVAGLAKAWRPHDTAGALRAARLPVGVTAVRAGALAEAGIGTWALATGSVAAHVAVAASYGAFTVFVAVVLARGLPVSTCGCLGRPDVPPTWTHVGLDLAGLVVAGAAAASGAPSLLAEMDRQPLAGVPFAALVAAGVTLAAATLSLLPRLRALAVERSR